MAISGFAALGLLCGNRSRSPEVHIHQGLIEFANNSGSLVSSQLLVPGPWHLLPRVAPLTKVHASATIVRPVFEHALNIC